MSRRTFGILAAGLVTVAALVLLAPAAGDWLVTRDGTRIETDGPWRVESRLIVFKQKDGTLGSLRTSEVDLEASRRLTEEMAARAAAPPAEAPQPRPKARVRLTQEDLPPAPPLPREDDGEGDSEEGEAPPEERAASPLDVSSFREVESGDGGIGFTGTVLNRSRDSAIGVEVTTVLFDREGEEIARAPAALTATALTGGESASFRVDFPEVFDYGRAEFQVGGQLLRTHPEDEEGSEPAAAPAEPEGEG